MNAPPALYVHVPFCATRCSYCDFYTTTETSLEAAYLEALALEAERTLPEGYRPETVFFGGGTPTLLSDADFERMVSILSRRADLAGAREWTTEANPETVTPAKAKLLRRLGIHRVSLGVQAFDDRRLDRLERHCRVEDVLRAYRLLRQEGFDALNLDLIFGAPGATMDDWKADLARAVDLAPEHLSTYCLTIEERTPMGRLYRQGKVRALPDVVQAEMHLYAMEFLQAHGYVQYEVSNFARPGRECLHNLHYWRGSGYYGLGPSACGLVGGVRTRNVGNVRKYAELLRAGTPPGEILETLGSDGLEREKRYLGIRTREGIPVPDGFSEALQPFLDAGMLAREGDRLRPTRKGFLFADEIAGALL